MLAVMIIPTGLGCEIGGHAGDATPAARLLALACDTLILHPNVVNASDINEMPSNSLYIEGSMLDRFLRGEIDLEPVKANKILVVSNGPISPDTVNAVSAARATLGVDAFLLELQTPLKMRGWLEAGGAKGEVEGWKELVKQVGAFDFDALAITTPIDVDDATKKTYLRQGGVNPWGKVEAMASRLIGDALQMPVAHSPTEDVTLKNYKEVVDPRMGAEMVSLCYLHCIMKGLHKAPRVCEEGISIYDVDCLISPYGCCGPPHEACVERGIPVIVVRENKTVLDVLEQPIFHYVDNYMEAAGLMLCMKEGIHPSSVRRPLAPTLVTTQENDDGEKQ